MTVLTPRQAEVVAIIESYAAENGYGPSFRDLAKTLGISVNGVKSHLDALEAKGVVQRTPGVARSLRVCRPLA